MRATIGLVAFSIMTLIGCSSAGSIQSTASSDSEFEGAVFDGELTVVNEPTPGVDSHRVFHQAATGFVSVQSIRQTAEKRVDDFCSREGRLVRVLSERTSKPPHILGNFPRIEIEFECIESGNSASRSTKYDDLAKLKDLLDDGAISETEYEAEKAKLLQTD